MNRLNKILGLTALILGSAQASITLKVDPSHPVLLENRAQRTIVAVGLEGADLPAPDMAKRLPVNISLVIDRSGSMSGDKMEQAREAARVVVDMLGPQDVLSLVTYSDEAETVVAARKVSDRSVFHRAIDQMYSSGNTALFGGVSKGLREVRRFKTRNRVNRVILVSDGMANVGPSSPSELAGLGRSAGREGITVTTIGLGLGYNEDLMSQLAMASDGNHAFVENSIDLAAVFQRELGGVLSVVAQEIRIRILCPKGVRPLQVLDQDAEIKGNQVSLDYNQIYGRQNKTILLEVEVQGKGEGQAMELAAVTVDYDDPRQGGRQTLQGRAGVRFSKDETVVRREVYKPVAIEAAKTQANIASKKALEFRDKGDYGAAGAIMQQNSLELQRQAVELGAPELKDESAEVEADAKLLSAPASSADWNRSRKTMKAKQHVKQSKFSIDSERKY